jgi:hypothetical protein
MQVKLPDAKQRFIIDSMALYVLKDGCEFEQMIMMEQQGRPEFDFMFDLDSEEHAYYRWRLYSLAGGCYKILHSLVRAYLRRAGGRAGTPRRRPFNFPCSLVFPCVDFCVLAVVL